MAIIVIKGSGDAAQLMADSLRNTAIQQGRGALLVRDGEPDGEAKHHLEKIIVADRFVEGTEAEDVNWKDDPTVILVGTGESRLTEFESICPGFTKKMGPVSKLNMA